MMRSVTPMRTAKIGYIVMSVFAIVIGTIMIAMPELLAKTMCMIIGIAAAAFGTVKLISYFSKDLFRLAFQFDLAEGILLIILGITTAVMPEMFLGMIGTVFGICVMADGLLKIQVALDAKTFGVSKWWLILTAAVLAVTAGFFLIINPIESSAVVAVITGITLLTEGIMNLITVLVAVKIIKNQLPDSDDRITVKAVHYTN